MARKGVKGIPPTLIGKLDLPELPEGYFYSFIEPSFWGSTYWYVHIKRRGPHWWNWTHAVQQNMVHLGYQQTPKSAFEEAANSALKELSDSNKLAMFASSPTWDGK